MATFLFTPSCGLRIRAQPVLPPPNFKTNFSCFYYTIDALQRCSPHRSISAVRSEANAGGRPRRNSNTNTNTNTNLKSSFDRVLKEQTKPVTSTSEEKSRRDEIMSLLNKIHASISKGKPVVLNKANNNNNNNSSSGSSSNNSNNNNSNNNIFNLQKKQSTESISKIKQVLDKAPRVAVEDDLPRHPPKFDKSARGVTLSTDFKITRPASRFVKRSPIPRPILKQEEVKNDLVASPKEELDQVELHESGNLEGEGIVGVELENLKISDLKEIARKRGLKCYSKLKKVELLEILMNLPVSS